MTHTTNNPNSLLFPHGGYRKLAAYQMAEIIHDLTVTFCDTYMSYKVTQSPRTYDQMVQAARSGKQNIAEGSEASGTSKKTELKLISVARASLEELLLDYQDFLRQKSLPIWEKDDYRVRQIRQLAYSSDKSFRTYQSYLTRPESAANCLICLIHQCNYLLDRLLQRLEDDFKNNGGFTEKLYRYRSHSS